MRTPESAISLRPSGSVLDSFDVSASMVFIFVRKAHDRESAGARKAARRASILSRLNEREAERNKRSEARIEQRRPRQQRRKRLVVGEALRTNKLGRRTNGASRPSRLERREGKVVSSLAG